MCPKRLLALAPHTDDVELGCGGTLARFIEEGVEIHVAAFSTAEESLPPGSPPNLLRDEFHTAMDFLGIQKTNRYVYNYSVRKLSYNRQDVLEELVKLRRAIQPDVVLIPSASDLHQDHQVLQAEGLRAYKDITLLGYELPWNHITFSAQAFVCLNEHHLNAKWKVLQAYKSQLTLNRPYFTEQFIKGLAKIRGVQIKAEYAEAFEVFRVKI